MCPRAADTLYWMPVTYSNTPMQCHLARCFLEVERSCDSCASVRPAVVRLALGATRVRQRPGVTLRK